MRRTSARCVKTQPRNIIKPDNRLRTCDYYYVFAVQLQRSQVRLLRIAVFILVLNNTIRIHVHSGRNALIST